MSTPKAVDTCSACKGRVVKETTSEYNPASGPPIIGPGYRNQCRDVTSYYCADCGLVYRLPPAQMKKRRKAHAIEVRDEDLPPHLQELRKQGDREIDRIAKEAKSRLAKKRRKS